MTAEAYAPVIDLAHRIPDDVTATVGYRPRKVGRIIGGGVGAAFIIGINRHLTRSRRPAIDRCPEFRRYVTLFAGQMGWNSSHHLFEISAVRCPIDTRISMTVLTLTDQGMGIAVMDAGASCRMTNRTQTAAIVVGGTTRRHGGYSTIASRGNQYSLLVGIEGMAGPTCVMDLAIGHADRSSGSRTGRGRVAGYTGSPSPIDHGAVIHGTMASCAVVRGGCLRIMMDAASRIGGSRMTGQTGCQLMQPRSIAK